MSGGVAGASQWVQELAGVLGSHSLGPGRGEAGFQACRDDVAADSRSSSWIMVGWCARGALATSRPCTA